MEYNIGVVLRSEELYDTAIESNRSPPANWFFGEESEKLKHDKSYRKEANQV